jgi:hypothetical protein
MINDMGLSINQWGLGTIQGDGINPISRSTFDICSFWCQKVESGIHLYIYICVCVCVCVCVNIPIPFVDPNPYMCVHMRWEMGDVRPMCR